MSKILVPDTYGLALLQSLMIISLIVLPGLCWNIATGSRFKLRESFLPLPGIMLLAVEGIIIWLADLKNGFGSTALVGCPLLFCLLAAIFRWPRISFRDILDRNGVTAIVIWGALVAGATATGMNPLPIALENYIDSSLPGRMVASQPDSMAPYGTAAYMSAGHDGRTLSDVYFSPDWNIGSRGPLAPLAILSVFRIAQAGVPDPPPVSVTAWPVTNEGTYIARAFGWITNGMVILALSHLLSALKISGNRYYFALAWAVLAPSIVVNTEFVWPKLFAAYFVICAIASVLENRLVLAGGLTALGWLSHPVGFLFLPGLCLLALWRERGPDDGLVSLLRRGWQPVAVLLVAFLLVASPWLAFKMWLGARDHFIGYLLAAGDPSRSAESLSAWLAFRWTNTMNTLVPGLYLLLGHMKIWFGHTLSEPLRWNVMYTKTLPGSLGYCLFIFAYIFSAWPSVSSSLRQIQLTCLLIPFSIMIIVWGFSNDGLGRASLEPLVPIMIAVSVARMDWPKSVQVILLSVLLIESKWVELSGFIYDEGFRWTTVPLVSWLLWAASIVISVFALVWAISWKREKPQMSLA